MKTSLRTTVLHNVIFSGNGVVYHMFIPESIEKSPLLP
jgi:hypothetical protein